MDLESRIFAASTTCSAVLEDAWRRFGDFDKNASLAQKRFLNQRKWIINLGVIVTTLAVVDLMLETSFLNEGSWFTQVVQTILSENQFAVLENWLTRGLNVIILIIPILISILVAGAVKFNMGICWVVLRSGSESIKHEIFQYRTQVGVYSPDSLSENGKAETRDMILARRIQKISERVMETQVNMSDLEFYDYKKEGLPPKNGIAPEDDGFSDLTAEQYLHWRVEDQASYYRYKTKKLARELQRFQWSIYIFGGLGTLLAAVQMEIWVAVTSAIVAALGSFIEFKRVESTLIGMNLAASDLENIRVRWRALSHAARHKESTKATLVKNAEAVIQGENESWLTEMREALSEVYDDDDDDGHEDNSPIALLPGSIHQMSESATSASNAFDSTIDDGGDSWLSAMRTTLAGTNPSVKEPNVTSDEQSESLVSSNVSPASNELPGEDSENNSLYSDETTDNISIDDYAAVYAEAEHEFYNDSGSHEQEDDVNIHSEVEEGTSDDSALEELDTGEPTDDDSTDNYLIDENWLDTPTNFDESLDSILDGTSPAPFANEPIGSGDGQWGSQEEVDGNTIDPSVIDEAIQMDLPDGYEEDLKAFSDPFDDACESTSYQQISMDKLEDENEANDAVSFKLNEMGNFVPVESQSDTTDFPDDISERETS